MPKIIKRGSPEGEVSQYHLQTGLMEMARQMTEVKQHPAGEEEYKPPEAPLDKALRQVEEILDVARQEAIEIKEEAREKGFKQGEAEGKEDGYRQAYNENLKKMEADREIVLNQVKESIAEMEVLKQELLDQHLNELRDIAVAIAEKIMRVGLQSSGDVIKRMIISATEKLTKTQWVKIYISKYDAELMAEGDAALLRSLSYLSDNIKIITMEGEEQGTCIIELPKGIIDASINTQMENIRGILNNVQL